MALGFAAAAKRGWTSHARLLQEAADSDGDSVVPWARKDASRTQGKAGVGAGGNRRSTTEVAETRAGGRRLPTRIRCGVLAAARLLWQGGADQTLDRRNSVLAIPTRCPIPSAPGGFFVCLRGGARRAAVPALIGALGKKRAWQPCWQAEILLDRLARGDVRDYPPRRT